LEFPVREVRQEEEIKGTQIGRELVKLSLFIDDMVIGLRDPKKSTQTLLGTINSFSTLTVYKINLQKSFCVNNEQIKKEYRKIIPFPITSKKYIKYPGVNLGKDVNDIYKKTANH
jgi:hypothetical protein